MNYVDRDLLRLEACVRLFARVSGMNAENEQRKVLGQSIAYVEDNYRAVIWEEFAKVPKVTP